MTSPEKIAELHCANFQPNKSCLGLGMSHSRCLLSDPTQRCRYFEDCVLPMGDRPGTNFAGLSTPADHQQFSEGARAYRHATGLLRQPTRPCPQCGRELEPRARLCYVCRDSNRKLTFEQSNRKR